MCYSCLYDSTKLWQSFEQILTSYDAVLVEILPQNESLNCIIVSIYLLLASHID